MTTSGNCYVPSTYCRGMWIWPSKAYFSLSFPLDKCERQNPLEERKVSHAIGWHAVCVHCKLVHPTNSEVESNAPQSPSYCLFVYFFKCLFLHPRSNYFKKNNSNNNQMGDLITSVFHLPQNELHQRDSFFKYYLLRQLNYQIIVEHTTIWRCHTLCTML